MSLLDTVLLSKNNVKDIHVTKLPDSLLTKAQKEFLYLMDSDNKLVDSLSWRNDYSKNKFFIERPLPNNKSLVILEGLGTPNSYNPLHIEAINVAHKKYVRSRFSMCFFALLLVLFATIKTN